MKIQLTSSNLSQLKEQIKDSKFGTASSLWILTPRGYTKVLPGEFIEKRGEHYEKVPMSSTVP